MNTRMLRGSAIAAAALVLAALLAWLAATRGPLAQTRVTVARAQAADLTLSTFGVGTVDARRAYSVGPTTAARVLRVLVDEGDTVVAGQLLAELDPVDLDERVTSARIAAERSAHAVAAAQAQHDEARSRAAVAAASARRTAELRGKGFVSQDAADARQHEATAAHSAAEAAAALLAAARQDRERAASDLAALGRLRAHARLVSPAKAVVSARLAEPGSTVVAGQAVVQLVDTESLWVRARIDQAQAGGIAIGQPAQIVLRSAPSRPLRGEVRRLDRVSDAVTEERIVHVDFAEPVQGLSVGEAAEVTIALAHLPAALSVPSAAVKRQDRREGVWRLQEGRIAFQPVRVGAVTPDGRSQILEGLAAGDAVVVHSERALEANARVKTVDALLRSGS